MVFRLLSGDVSAPACSEPIWTTFIQQGQGKAALRHAWYLMISHMSTDRKSENRVSRPARNAETLYLHLQKVHRSMSWQVSRFVHIATRISFNLRSSDDKFLNCAFWWKWHTRFAPRIIVSKKSVPAISPYCWQPSPSNARRTWFWHVFKSFLKNICLFLLAFCAYSSDSVSVSGNWLMKQHLIGRQCGDVIPMSSLNPGDGWIVVPGMKTPMKTPLAFLHYTRR